METRLKGYNVMLFQHVFYFSLYNIGSYPITENILQKENDYIKGIVFNGKDEMLALLSVHKWMVFI